MMVFLKTILIFLLIYFGAKFLFRLFTPYLIRFASRKVDERFQNMFQDFSNQHQNQNSNGKEEGEVSIDKIPKQHKKSNNSVGEYIDFEEIE